jgi:hypothetical protein
LDRVLERDLERERVADRLRPRLVDRESLFFTERSRDLERVLDRLERSLTTADVVVRAFLRATPAATDSRHLDTAAALVAVALPAMG